MTWAQTEPRWPDFQLATWRHEETKLVLAVEVIPGAAPWDREDGFQTVVLPEEYWEDVEPIEYLCRGVDQEEAEHIAELHMESEDE